MTAQTSYEIKQPKAYAGLLYSVAPHDIVSRLVEGADGIAFGVAVSSGTNKERQIVVGGTSFLGITIRSLDKEGAANTGAIQWDENEAASVLRGGYVWAVCSDGCVPGDSVRYTDATGVLNSGTATSNETQLDGATWETDTGAGELGVIRLETSKTTAGV